VTDRHGGQAKKRPFGHICSKYRQKYAGEAMSAADNGKKTFVWSCLPQTVAKRRLFGHVCRRQWQKSICLVMSATNTAKMTGF
jgi:hypothetical protein